MCTSHQSDFSKILSFMASFALRINSMLSLDSPALHSPSFHHQPPLLAFHSTYPLLSPNGSLHLSHTGVMRIALSFQAWPRPFLLRVLLLSFVTRAGIISSVQPMGIFLASFIGFPGILNILCVSLLGHWSVYKGVLFVLTLLSILLGPELLVGKVGPYSVWSPQNLV